MHAKFQVKMIFGVYQRIAEVNLDYLYFSNFIYLAINKLHLLTVNIEDNIFRDTTNY